MRETSGETTMLRTWFGRLMLLALLAMMVFALNMPVASAQVETDDDIASGNDFGFGDDDMDGFGDEFPFGNDDGIDDDGLDS